MKFNLIEERVKEITNSWISPFKELKANTSCVKFTPKFNVLGVEFSQVELAKEFLETEVITLLERIHKKRPIFFLNKEDGFIDVSDEWPGPREAKKETIDKIVKALSAEFGSELIDIAEDFIRKTPRSSRGISINFLVDIKWE